MPFRRLTLRVLVALMTSLSMLHLAVEGSGAVCSSTPAESAQSEMAMSDTGSHAGHATPATSTAQERPASAQQQSDPHAPAQERCCESMSSCGVSTVASMVERVSAPLPASRIPTHAGVMLASVGTAPEPPLPKA
jgi:hypothetical protein